MLLRRVARPLLAAIFVSGGISELRAPDYHTEPARWIRNQGAQAVPSAANADPQLLSQVDAAVKIGAGSLLALGWMPRVAATALAANIIPTTLAAHSFWEIKDEGERTAQQIHFFKNCGLLGGLLLAAADTEGKPSAGWRAKQTRKDARRAAKVARKAASRESEHLSRRARKAAAKEAERSAKRAAKAGDRLSEVRGAGKAAVKVGPTAGRATGKAGTHAGKATKRDLERARKAAGRRAEATSAKLSERVGSAA